MATKPSPKLVKAGTWDSLQKFPDTLFNVVGSSDNTKIVRFEADGLTTGTTRTITVPDADLELQSACEVKSGNWTSRLHGQYTLIASATVTDPSPSAGHEVSTFVRNGTLTTSRGTYSVPGTMVKSVWHSGAWADYAYGPLGGLNVWSADQTFNANVGIGTSPSYKLHVAGSSFITAFISSSFTAASKEYTGLFLGKAASSNQSCGFGFVYDQVTPSNSFSHITPYSLTEGNCFKVNSDGTVSIGGGWTTGNGLLQLASGTTKANGIAFGTDTFLYRLASNILATPGVLYVGEAAGSSDITIEVGRNRTADGNAYFDLIATSGGTDYNARLIRFSGTNGITQFSHTGTGDLQFNTEGAAALVLRTNSTSRVTVDSAGNVVLAASALATNATDRFTYVPSCAGTPTGVPTSKTGAVPIVVDSTNNKLYFYSGGAWRDAGP